MTVLATRGGNVVLVDDGDGMGHVESGQGVGPVMPVESILKWGYWKPVAETAAAWDESKHPRDPGGEGGGEFVVRTGGELFGGREHSTEGKSGPPYDYVREGQQKSVEALEAEYPGERFDYGDYKISQVDLGHGRRGVAVYDSEWRLVWDPQPPADRPKRDAQGRAYGMPSWNRKWRQAARNYVESKQGLTAAGPLPGEGPLVRKYELILERNAKRCKRNYLRASQVITAAAQDRAATRDSLEASWTGIVLRAAGEPQQNRNPLLGEVLDEQALEESTRATDAIRKRIAEEAARQTAIELGISFAVVSPYVHDLVLAQAGRQAERIVAGSRDLVASLILRSLQEGWSVPQTADALYDGLVEAKNWQATMLARTDLIAMANGGSFAAASAVGDARPLYKRWKNADDAKVRPTHVEAEDQVVPLASPFVVGGAALMFPGDPSGPDNEVINCRCTLVYTDNPGAMVSAGWDESKHPRDPGGEGGGQWVGKSTGDGDLELTSLDTAESQVDSLLGEIVGWKDEDAADHAGNAILSDEPLILARSQDGQLVGVAGIHEEVDAVWISSIGSDAPGTGRALVDEASRIAVSRGKPLQVAAERQALGFYRKLGFTEIDRRGMIRYMQLTAAGWDESEHPRHPEGSSEGGRWAIKGADAFVPELIPDTYSDYLDWIHVQDSQWGTWEDITEEDYSELAHSRQRYSKILAKLVPPELAEMAKIRVQNTIATKLEGDEDFRSLIARLDPHGDWKREFEAGGTFATADTVEKQVAALATATWARTSGDSDPISMQFQMAAEQEFQLEANSFIYEEWARLEAESPTDYGEAKWSDQEMRGARKFLRAQYELTQEMLAKAGIHEVILYRGMAWRPGEVPAEIETLRNTRRGSGIIAVHGNPLSSWSTQYNTAESFTSKYEVKAVSGTKIDARRVLATPFTGFGCLSESEMVVLGGTDMDAMTWTWNSGYYEPTGPEEASYLAGQAGPGSGEEGEATFVQEWVSAKKRKKS